MMDYDANSDCEMEPYGPPISHPGDRGITRLDMTCDEFRARLAANLQQLKAHDDEIKRRQRLREGTVDVEAARATVVAEMKALFDIFLVLVGHEVWQKKTNSRRIVVTYLRTELSKIKHSWLGPYLNVFQSWRSDEHTLVNLTFDGSSFYPGPRTTNPDPSFFNTWTGFAVDQEFDVGNLAVIDMELVDTVLEKIKHVLANDDDVRYKFLVNFLADMFQNPQFKRTKAFVFMGMQGAGKNCCIEFIGKLIGSSTPVKKGRFVVLKDGGLITSNFNALASEQILILIEEEQSNGKMVEGFNTLKSKISNPMWVVGDKHVKDGLCLDYSMMFICSNESDAVKIEQKSDRRTVLMPTGNKYCNDPDAWNAWFAHTAKPEVLVNVFKYFLTYDLTGFNRNDPYIPPSEALVAARLKHAPLAAKWLRDRYFGSEDGLEIYHCLSETCTDTHHANAVCHGGRVSTTFILGNGGCDTVPTVALFADFTAYVTAQHRGQRVSRDAFRGFLEENEFLQGKSQRQYFPIKICEEKARVTTKGPGNKRVKCAADATTTVHDTVRHIKEVKNEQHAVLVLQDPAVIYKSCIKYGWVAPDYCQWLVVDDAA